MGNCESNPNDSILELKDLVLNTDENSPDIIDNNNFKSNQTKNIKVSYSVFTHYINIM